MQQTRARKHLITLLIAFGLFGAAVTAAKYIEKLTDHDVDNLTKVLKSGHLKSIEVAGPRPFPVVA